MARRTKRKTAQVVVLPGVERRDLLGELPDKTVLQAAIDNGAKEVIVIGRDRQGGLYLAGTMDDADRTVGRLMQAVAFLTSLDTKFERSQ
jgi:hypothetical protein